MLVYVSCCIGICISNVSPRPVNPSFTASFQSLSSSSMVGLQGTFSAVYSGMWKRGYDSQGAPFGNEVALKIMTRSRSRDRDEYYHAKVSESACSQTHPQSNLTLSHPKSPLTWPYPNLNPSLTYPPNLNPSSLFHPPSSTQTWALKEAQLVHRLCVRERLADLVTEVGIQAPYLSL